MKGTMPMTILECIKKVLGDNNQGLTSKEIHAIIVDKGMYSFGAAHPVSVVSDYIRKRCVGLDFPSAYPEKLFEIVGFDGKQPKYALISNGAKNQPEEKASKKESSDRLPEEKIMDALDKHIAALKAEITEQILKNSPSFFERLVVDLLLKMGYGYDSDSGFVTGQSHDGGIDGIIYQDNLGLDRIYIQAKRYAIDNKVGRATLQAFVGAMEDVQKGVFITTSQFTNEAVSYATKQQQKQIKLIDGSLLSELLVKYEIGLSAVQEFKIYKVDTDYYGG